MANVTPTKFQQIIQAIESQAKDKNLFRAKNLQALEWHRQKLQTAFANNKTSIGDLYAQAQPKKISPIFPGWFCTFLYSPKGKETLPYYDRFPLTLILDIKPDGFLGLNFHYLRPIDRAYFMDHLYKLEVPDSAHQTFRINITYEILKANKRYRYYKPCIKKYLKSHIRNFLIPVYPEEWDIALFLPTEKFVGLSRDKVWEESKGKY